MTMKKLPITRKQFTESKYFQKKYGKLEYVSESGKFFKTDKGRILKFMEETTYGLSNDELEKELADELDDPHDWDVIYYVSVDGRDAKFDGVRSPWESKTYEYVYKTKEEAKKDLDEYV